MYRNEVNHSWGVQVFIVAKDANKTSLIRLIND